MDHPAPHDLDPAGTATNAAPRTFAVHALGVDLGGWLGKRKIRRPEPDPHFLVIETAHEPDHRALQVGEADALVHDQSLHLVKHRRMREVGLTPKHPAGTDDADRGSRLLHDAHLHGRRMRSQDVAAFEVEGIPHRSGWMMRRQVECFEVVIVVFDLRARHDPVAGTEEDVLDPPHRLRNRMQASRVLATAGQRHVDDIFAESSGELLRRQRRSARFDCLYHGVFRRIVPSARRRPLSGVEEPQRPGQQRQLALFPQVFDPDFVQPLGTVGSTDRT